MPSNLFTDAPSEIGPDQKPVSNPAVCEVPALRWSDAEGVTDVRETVVVEAPLAFEIVYDAEGERVRRLLGITMRTPGQDFELALGFLLAEGVISRRDDVLEHRLSSTPEPDNSEAKITLKLRGDP